jgi:hypothetical protein
LTERYYFVARLTRNSPNDDSRPGDRVLGVWQTLSGYVLAAEEQIGKTEVGDMEGVWTHICFSYSQQVSRGVALVKFGSDRPRRV